MSARHIGVLDTISYGRPPSSLGGAAPVASWVGVPPSQLPQSTRPLVLIVVLTVYRARHEAKSLNHKWVVVLNACICLEGNS
ncbi:hypothetical protein RSOL_105100, partial [Rhizoctonia solani AG-3 Rhs1AP]